MGRSCSTCNLPPSTIVEVHDAIDSGTDSVRAIAVRHHLDPRSLRRHLESHRSRAVEPEILDPEAPAPDVNDQALITRAAGLLSRCDTIMEKAEADAPLVALKAIAEERLLLASVSALLAKVEERRVTREFDLRIAAAWRELREIVEDALLEFPEARARLVLALTRDRGAAS